jgi:hypothetical protein
MNGRSAILRWSLAALVAVILLALGLRLGGQANALGDAQGELADVESKAADLQTAAAAQMLGPPLLDAKVSAPEKQLEGVLTALGLAVKTVRVASVTAAGPSLVVARTEAEGQADAAALDRLALWAQANPRSVILQRLSASARADGHSDVQVELDVLVRGMTAPAA